MIYEKNKTKNISFPLGGIGTGCIGLAGNGELNDWEIFNRPDKRSRNGYSHFAVKMTQGGKSITRVLHGDTCEDLLGTPCASTGHYGFGYGPKGNSLAGFPHFGNVCFKGEFPIAELTFSDVDLPAVMRLCAFNPFIPHDEFNSSLPAAFFEWEAENRTDEELELTLAFTVCNPSDSSLNKAVYGNGISGVFMGCEEFGKDEKGYSDLCILTDHPDTAVQENWFRGGWQDSVTVYWKNLTALDRLPERKYPDASPQDHGTVAAYARIKPREKMKFRFVAAWNVPTAYNYWAPREEGGTTWKNYYATQFKDSFETAKYALENYTELYGKTKLFSEALQASTLPEHVKEAVSANLSVLKTPTAMRLEDGSFWGWEGCCETVGSCFGTCQHVWNYAYVLPFLFPRLERSIRENVLEYGLLEDGSTSFRLNLPFKREMATGRACVDGQMGEIIKFYREWKFSGDSQWLKKHAEDVFGMLEYAWSEKNPDKWDADMDGVLDGRQHHTLDMELFGASSWLQGFYLLALYCCAEMAEFLGDVSRASLYRELYGKGRAWLNENLFNGRYFCQKTDLSDRAVLGLYEGAECYWNDEANEIKYQIGEGCIIDQMLADWHASVIGAEGVFDRDKKRVALEHLYKYNYKSSMREVTNMWRNFSLNDEAGTVICSYPEGSYVPAIPIPYCEETMTGFEYALAGLMIAEGFVAEGESMVKAVRDRYDGEKRNPWNEIECGSNYARSMASFALLPIYSGFSFDMTEKHVGFAPVSGEGRYLFSICDTWGSVTLTQSGASLTVLGEPLKLRSLSVPHGENAIHAEADGKPVEFTFSEGRIVFGEEVVFKALSVTV